MSKILSKAGESLADVYDVEGSIAGIDQLETRELPIVHEMGHTVFSERLSGEVVRFTTGALAQNLTFDATILPSPVTPFRILSVIVLVDTAARVNRAQISLRDPVLGREVPIFAWHTTDDGERGIRIVENGAASGNMTELVMVQGAQQTPNLGIGAGQLNPVHELAFRGLTAGFGAGDVTTIALVYIAFPELGGVSSRGLPLPGW